MRSLIISKCSAYNVSPSHCLLLLFDSRLNDGYIFVLICNDTDYWCWFIHLLWENSDDINRLILKFMYRHFFFFLQKKKFQGSIPSLKKDSCFRENNIYCNRSGVLTEMFSVAVPLKLCPDVLYSNALWRCVFFPYVHSI